MPRALIWPKGFANCPTCNGIGRAMLIASLGLCHLVIDTPMPRLAGAADARCCLPCVCPRLPLVLKVQWKDA